MSSLSRAQLLRRVGAAAAGGGDRGAVVGASGVGGRGLRLSAGPVPDVNVRRGGDGGGGGAAQGVHAGAGAGDGSMQGAHCGGGGGGGRAARIDRGFGFAARGLSTAAEGRDKQIVHYCCGRRVIASNPL